MSLIRNSLRYTGGGAATLIRRDTYDVFFYGSSSTEGNQDGLGHTVSYYLALNTPGNKAVTNRGIGGTSTEGGLGTPVKTQMAAATGAEKLGTIIVQYDTNNFSGNTFMQAGHVHAADFKANVIDAGLIGAAAVAGKRFVAWAGANDGVVTASLRNKTFQSWLWPRYPGQVVNMQDYWPVATQDPTFTSVTGVYTGATDVTTLSNVQIPVSYQIPDRSHPSSKGSLYFNTAWEKDFVESLEASGCPWFAYHEYYVNVASAQVNGGDVVQLAYTGDLTGATLQAVTSAGAAHPDFAISATGMVTRASATTLTAQLNYLYVKVTKAGNTKTYRLAIKIGESTGVPRRKTVDGHMFGALETNDNAGTDLVPSYPTATVRQWAGLGAGPFVEQSVVIDFQPGNFDAIQMFLWFNSVGIQISRTSLNFMRVSNRDNAATAIGQITTSGAGGGLANFANGRFLMFYSIKVDGGSPYQQLILDDGTNVIRHTATPPGMVGNGTININPLATSLASSFMNILGSTNFGQDANGVALSSPTANVRGNVGFMWMATSAIDFSVAANRALFRSSLASLTDLTVNDASHPGDGKSVIVQAGGSGLNVGSTIAPYYYDRGGAADFGRNFGTGGDIVVFNRLDPTGASPSQGIANTI